MNKDISDIRSIIKLAKIVCIIAVIAGLCSCGAYIYSKYFAIKKYTSSVVMCVHDPHTHQFYMVCEPDTHHNPANTYMDIIKSNRFFERISDKISENDIYYTASEIAKMTRVEIVDDTELIRISVSTYDKEHSKIIADTIAQVSQEEIMCIFKDKTVTILLNAKTADVPSYPNVWKNTVIGTISGFIFACVIVFFLKKNNRLG